MRLNKEQSKFLAGAIEKASLAYYGLFGYTSYTSGNWFVFIHVTLLFAVVQGGALWILRTVKEQADEHSQ
jgi:hypothetical protein